MEAAAEAIIADALRQADFHHSQVLRDGFCLSGTCCPHCNFPGNSEKFYRFLIAYTRCKQLLHRIGWRDRWYSYARNGCPHDDWYWKRISEASLDASWLERLIQMGSSSIGGTSVSGTES